MVERYQSMVTGNGGQVHRFEDWGRRQLSHSINKIHKAHYVLMNVECEQSVLDEIQSAFKFNDAVLRHLVIRRDEAVTEASHLARSEEELAAKPARETEEKVSAEAAKKEAAPEAAKEEAAPEAAKEEAAPEAAKEEAAPEAAKEEAAPEAAKEEAAPEAAKEEAAPEAAKEEAAPEAAKEEAAPEAPAEGGDGDDASDAESEKTAG
jgi:small subunit ribosomal protein S6